MDLLATVRKEGSRGGTGDFKWSDVQASSRRENYLGHSVMAPVGRWQKGRDLNWYAKAEGEDGDQDLQAQAARERAEEIKRIKEAEEDALARALGLPVPDRSNANLQPLGNRSEVNRIVRDAANGEDDDTDRSLGFTGHKTDKPQNKITRGERIEGNVNTPDNELQFALKEYRRRHGEKRTSNDQMRSRSRSRSPDFRRHRHDEKRADGDRGHQSRPHGHSRRHHSRDRQSHHYRRRRSRSRSPKRRRSHDRKRNRSTDGTRRR